MSEHTSTGPAVPVAAPETEMIPTTPAATTQAAVTTTDGQATMHPADAAYLPSAAGTPQSAHEADKPYVTIVLPCFNEAEHVLQEIERITATMNSSEFTYELLCIDDASTDDTLEVLHQAARDYANIRVMPFRRNGGSGTARRIGTQQAFGEIVVWTDADMTYENERTKKMF